MKQGWVIQPRDPLVFGNGVVPAAFVRRGERLPHPGTIAGMVRASFIADPSAVTRDRALELLRRISVRGPWLVRMAPDGAAAEPWVPAPGDGVVSGAASGNAADRSQPSEVFRRAEILFPNARDEGVLWPSGVPSELGLVRVPDHGSDGSKTKSIAEEYPFWSLTHAVRWALGEHVTPADVRPQKKLLDREHRVHVAMDNASNTALPGQLYSSPGVRFDDDFAIAVEVEVAGEVWPPSSEMVVLGGESRLSFRRLDDRATFPEFTKYEQSYVQASKRSPRGLRVQLLTPAYLPASSGAEAWLPARVASGLPELHLVAAQIPAFVAVSGWNLQASAGRGAPRAVRRLVPAGSTYYFRLPDRPGADGAIELLNACRFLWGKPIEPEPPDGGIDTEQHLAHPARDGYGLVLPGFWFDGDNESEGGS